MGNATTFGCNLQLLLGVDVRPYALHVIPVVDDAVFNGIAELEQAAVLLASTSASPFVVAALSNLCPRTNKLVPLQRPSHDAHVLGLANAAATAISASAYRMMRPYKLWKTHLGTRSPANPALMTPDPCGSAFIEATDAILVVTHVVDDDGLVGNHLAKVHCDAA